jgi:uncharacterized protein YcfJ
MDKRSKRIWQAASTAAGVLFAGGAALAYPYAGDAYGPPDQAYAEVLSSTPVYRQVRVVTPRQECYQQQVVYPDYGNSLAGTLLGGLVGGVVGHQIGRGSGNTIATGVGAVVGASVGNHLARASDAPEVGYQERCRTVEEVRYEQRPDGYDVTYRYGGRIYRTHLPYDPGPRLLVNVNVAPAAY